MITSTKPGNVKLYKSLFTDRMKVNRDYLMELDTSCLLQNFYFEAGIVTPKSPVNCPPSEIKMHWGWESPDCQLRGHFLGHFMSAASMLIAENEDLELKAKLDFIVDELARCQELNGGEWIGSIPEKYFDFLERNIYVWSPQYTMHKTLMGLTHAYAFTNNEKALTVLENVAKWYTEWTAKMGEVAPDAIYAGEMGGMPEIWAFLYELTANHAFLDLAEVYMGHPLFKSLSSGKDALSNMHANESIPLAHGAAKMYEITGDDKWLKTVKNFWKKAVTDRGMFATTGSNAGEFWIPPHKHADYIGDRNQEFCTVYNMVRIADYLFKFTGDKEYADYIERCLYNGFLAQQNKFTGMPTYFLPMKKGSVKKWGSKTNDFWCCFGTMIQAQTLYPNLIYYRDDNRLYLNQYIPSSYTEDGIDVSLTSNMKFYSNAVLFDTQGDSDTSRWSYKLKAKSKEFFTISIRIPDWIEGKPSIKLDGKPFTDAVVEKGYLSITKLWSDDEIEILFTPKLIYEPVEGSKTLVSVLEGPIVLAALLNGDNLTKKDVVGKLRPHYEHTYSEFPWLQSSYYADNTEFVPLYEVIDEPYQIIF